MLISPTENVAASISVAPLMGHDYNPLPNNNEWFIPYWQHWLETPYTIKFYSDYKTRAYILFKWLQVFQGIIFRAVVFSEKGDMETSLRQCETLS